MKDAQRTWIIVALVLFLISIVLLPIESTSGLHWCPFFEIGAVKVDYVRLAFEWVAIAILTTLGLLLAKSRPKE